MHCYPLLVTSIIGMHFSPRIVHLSWCHLYALQSYIGVRLVHMAISTKTFWLDATSY